jgi:hypothetical protein
MKRRVYQGDPLDMTHALPAGAGTGQGDVYGHAGKHREMACAWFPSLTVRARPKARPDMRAANCGFRLQSPGKSPSRAATFCAIPDFLECRGGEFAHVLAVVIEVCGEVLDSAVVAELLHGFASAPGANLSGSARSNAGCWQPHLPDLSPLPCNEPGECTFGIPGWLVTL